MPICKANCSYLIGPDYQSVAELKKAIIDYIEFYNHKRRHQSLDYKTPAQIYLGGSSEGKPVNIWASPSD